ncbi:hypothetical protein NEFER03_1562 [Nematocida sp. LUAm3]|nr:hypothetical protein NEFER03_1562 [Nematocida sp. LUAm3]KAI5174595.1 hypothetical protein NEFER02_0716 [Nematocida sp. LUAm2]KAI5177999.1 hypothetical protein NEFER01_1181 [Nematocida sp. LUAm1]
MKIFSRMNNRVIVWIIVFGMCMCLDVNKELLEKNIMATGMYTKLEGGDKRIRECVKLYDITKKRVIEKTITLIREINEKLKVADARLVSKSFYSGDGSINRGSIEKICENRGRLIFLKKQLECILFLFEKHKNGILKKNDNLGTKENKKENINSSEFWVQISNSAKENRAKNVYEGVYDLWESDIIKRFYKNAIFYEPSKKILFRYGGFIRNLIGKLKSPGSTDDYTHYVTRVLESITRLFLLGDFDFAGAIMLQSDFKVSRAMIVERWKTFLDEIQGYHLFAGRNEIPKLLDAVLSFQKARFIIAKEFDVLSENANTKKEYQWDRDTMENLDKYLHLKLPLIISICMKPTAKKEKIIEDCDLDDDLDENIEKLPSKLFKVKELKRHIDFALSKVTQGIVKNTFNLQIEWSGKNKTDKKASFREAREDFCSDENLFKEILQERDMKKDDIAALLQRIIGYMGFQVIKALEQNFQSGNEVPIFITQMTALNFSSHALLKLHYMMSHMHQLINQTGDNKEKIREILFKKNEQLIYIIKLIQGSPDAPSFVDYISAFYSSVFDFLNGAEVSNSHIPYVMLFELLKHPKGFSGPISQVLTNLEQARKEEERIELELDDLKLHLYVYFMCKFPVYMLKEEEMRDLIDFHDGTLNLRDIFPRDPKINTEVAAFIKKYVTFPMEDPVEEEKQEKPTQKPIAKSIPA